MEYLQTFFRPHFARKPVVVSQNVSYFLRVASISSAELELLFPITYEFVYT